AMNESTDKIERQITLRAPIARVWRAVSNAKEFGGWFGVDVAEGEFAPGARVRGKVTHEGYRHLVWDVAVVDVEPPHRISWRWQPDAKKQDANSDYTSEPTTLVTFLLRAVSETETHLTITETGFDALPPTRRETAYRGNSGGWDAQIQAIARHVA